MMNCFFKKFLNFIPYLALFYFIFARFFLISQYFSFDINFKNISEKFITLNHDNIDEKVELKTKFNKEKNRQKIFSAFFSFYVDALLGKVFPLILNFIFLIFALNIYEKIIFFWQKNHYQMRAPPCFS